MGPQRLASMRKHPEINWPKFVRQQIDLALIEIGEKITWNNERKESKNK